MEGLDQISERARPQVQALVAAFMRAHEDRCEMIDVVSAMIGALMTEALMLHFSVSGNGEIFLRVARDAVARMGASLSDAGGGQQ